MPLCIKICIKILLLISALITGYVNENHVHATWSDVKEFRTARRKYRYVTPHVMLFSSTRREGYDETEGRAKQALAALHAMVE